MTFYVRAVGGAGEVWCGVGPWCRGGPKSSGELASKGNFQGCGVGPPFPLTLAGNAPRDLGGN
eukprot:scaffold1220_cov117-Isochrysis_galbana.AAC.3